MAGKLKKKKKGFTIPSSQGNAIRTTLRFHLFPIRKARICETNGHRGWHGCGERTLIPLIHCCCGCKVARPLWKSAWRFLKKIGVDLFRDPALSALAIYSRDNCSSIFIASLIKSPLNRNSLDVHPLTNG